MYLQLATIMHVLLASIDAIVLHHLHVKNNWRDVTMNQQAVLNDDQAVLGLFDKYCEL